MEKYPRYDRGEVEKLAKLLTKQEKNILHDFLQSCLATSGPNKVSDIRRAILQLRHITRKELNKITIKELRTFLVLLNQSDREEWTKNGIKAHVKRFLKWMHKDWSDRFNNFREAKSRKIEMNEEKINDNTLLKPDEIQTVLKKENDLSLKTFFITLYQSGMRPGELRKAKWIDVKFDVDKDDLTEINVFMTKNKKYKTVYVKEASFYLKKLQAESQNEENPSIYVFPSREKKKRGEDEIEDKPMGDSTATRWINLLGHHINKKIYPYLLRHTRSQELYELADEGKISETMVAKFLGHSKSMRSTYAKISKKGIKNASMKVIYKDEDMPEEKKHELEIKYEEMKNEMERLQKMVQKMADDELRNRPNYIIQNGKISPVSDTEWVDNNN